MAAAPRGWAGGSRWTWRPVARDALLARAFHSCTELRGRLYLVGGLLAGGATEPSGDTVVLDLEGDQAVRMGARGGPRRSHHDAVPLGGRWLCAVGGWDGSRRLAAVAALDTERGEWEAWAAAPGSCPPAGLSSHTCTRLSDREVRVAGREGGTRTQRRFGSIYTLRLDPGARTYCSAEPEVAGHWSPGTIKDEPTVAPRLMEQLAKFVSSGRGSQQGPRGLRHHSCSVVGPFAVMFGGEALTRPRDAVCNDLYIYDARKSRQSPSLWFHFPCADRGLKRVGHRTCLWNDQLYLVGGFGEDGRTASPQVYVLDLFI
ncbi:kelch domain-containing protein 9 isoform X3 [Rousettus aegyptiacus]|uniref:kelch domain-containing protein 9 isoform X3 n=1 Tax=Rousettus aegyptiacus TaxID=9407 RepID=UPI00168D187B|nr:kelch domain-containing protein 9 isoform X3 [Rousettus aegyptiacus]